MKSGLFAVLVSAVLLVTMPVFPEETSSPDPRERLEGIDWLEGHWRGPADEGEWEAIYGSPEGGLILGVSKQIVDEQVVLFEYERFAVEGDDVIMAPSPAGRPSPIVFTLTEFDAEAPRAVFTNPTHDFPQILTYHRVADDRLSIRVEARREAGLFGFELDLTLQDED
jgi:hypothetical protein